jgi:hypothetical protein
MREDPGWFARQLKPPTVTEQVELRSLKDQREIREMADLMRPLREGGDSPTQ